MANLVWVTVLSAAVGATAAFATVALMPAGRTGSQGLGREARQQAPRAPAALPQSTTIVVESEPRDLGALREEVAQLRQQMDPGDQDTSSPDPEEDRREVEWMYAELERRHADDPIDPGWAPAASRNLSDGLTEFSEKAGFTLVSAECKTALCRATVEWKNYGAALQTGNELAERSLRGLDCVQSISLRPPDDPQAPYAANLYLDCTGQRGGSAEVASATK